jgi:hypothetical protein
MDNPEKLATYEETKIEKKKKKKKKQQPTTQYVLDTTMRKQTHIT